MPGKRLHAASLGKAGWPQQAPTGAGGGAVRLQYDYGAVRRWTLPARTLTADVVTGRELLLVPINHSNVHW